jgi:hypothetical protein
MKYLIKDCHNLAMALTTDILHTGPKYYSYTNLHSGHQETGKDLLYYKELNYLWSKEEQQQEP